MQLRTCPHCKTQIRATGLGNHVKSCVKKSPQERAFVTQRIKQDQGYAPVAQVNGAGSRVQITISVDLADLKAILGLLIPNVSIDKVQVS